MDRSVFSPKPDITRVPSRIPRSANTSKDLSNKWGIPDADRVLESAGDRRVTRKAAQITRSGAPVPEPVSLVYRGHNGLRVRQAHNEEQMGTVTPSSDGEPAAPSAGAPVIERFKLHGEPAAPSAGAPIEEKPQSLSEPAAPSVGAPEEEDLRSEAETAAHAVSSRPEVHGDTLPEGWMLTVSGPSTQLPSPRILSVATRFFPSWFDLSEQGDGDPYGPIPKDWLLDTAGIPVLPNIQIESSLVNEFWNEIDSSDEERDLQCAIQASITTAVEECEKREKWQGLSAMALLVEVGSEDEPEATTSQAAPENPDPAVPVVPAGQHGRYTSKQKGKEIPRTKDQREFLRRYVLKARSERDQTKSTPSPGQGKNKTPQGPAQFKREPSLVPEGGWFRASTTAGGRGPPRKPPSSSSSSEPGSDSSDSSDESDGSSSSPSSSSSSPSDQGPRGKSPSERRHREKQKRETRRIRKALAGVKIKPPFSWNGTPDLDLFDQWTYEVDTWRELYGLSDKLSIKLVVQFLTGVAGKFFMKHVTTCQAEWDMASLYEALFDYCFPTHYKAQLRLQLERAVQGKTKVRDFVREIQHLAARFPDVSDFQLAQIFWRGVQGYIRVYLIEKGLHPERTALEKMVKYAARREEAYLEARKDECAFEGQVPGRTWGRFANRATGPATYQPQREPREPPNRRNQETRPARDPRQRSPNQHRRGDHKKGNKSKKLSKEDRDKLRAEGRCFSCGEKGHESRNCDQRKTARVPNVGVSASSIRFANIERLADRA